MAIKIIDYIQKQGYNKIWAEQLLDNHKVQINKQVINDQNLLVNDRDIVTIDTKKVWVSRGALKLLAAIEQFKLQFDQKVVLDIGASTGGFTEVSLRCKAKKVYALDVGTNQLEYKLRINKRVVVYEKTHLKTINDKMFKEKIDIVVVDVSFISLKYVFEVLEAIKHSKMILIALIKPQFEAPKDQVAMGGYVEKKYHDQIIEQINAKAKAKGFRLKKIIESPIQGLRAKNIEYIAYYQANSKGAK